MEPYFQHLPTISKPSEFKGLKGGQLELFWDLGALTLRVLWLKICAATARSLNREP